MVADAELLGAIHALRLAVALAVLAFGLPSGLARVLCLLCAFSAAGAYSMAERIAEGRRHSPEAPFEATVEGTVERLTRRPGQLDADLGRVARVDGSGPPIPTGIRVHARQEEGAALLVGVRPGDRLRVRLQGQPLRGATNPGGRDRERELLRSGIGATARLAHPVLSVRLPAHEGWRPLGALHALRADAGARLVALGPGGGLLAALALGDRQGLRHTTRDGLRRLGISHLLAVSGLHLALVAAGLYRVVRRVLSRLPKAPMHPDPRLVALGVAALGALAYALLAGWGVPVRRAIALLGALVCALCARRPVCWSGPLAAAALVILAFDPAALFDPGAQLSFVASAGLLAAVRVAPRRSDSVRGWLRPGGRIHELLSATATASAVTAPVVANSFGNLASAALLANLVAIPWVGLVLLPVSLGAAALAATGWDAPAVAFVLRAAAGVGDATLAGCTWGASVAPPVWPSRPAAWALLLAAVAALGTLRVRRAWLRAVAALTIAAGLAVAPPPAESPRRPRAVVLDVGQGDATLVQGRQASILIDAGTALPGGIDLGRSVVVPALRALGVRRLALLVLSHADLDHRGGVPSVLASLPVDRLWVPRGALSDPAFRGVLLAAKGRGVRIEERGRGSPALELGDLRTVPLWPPKPDGRRSRNDGSLVVRIEVAGKRLLLPGDIEASAEAALLERPAELRADWLKLPHHGSRSSSSRGFLRAVGGRVAVASAPRFGRFGMPHPEVRARLRETGYALWWTGRDGAVWVGLEQRLWMRGTPR